MKAESGDLPPIVKLWINFADHVSPAVWYGTPTPLGLAGHSWGAEASARAALRGKIFADALVSIAGTWHDTVAINAMRGVGWPTLMISGTEGGAAVG